MRKYLFLTASVFAMVFGFMLLTTTTANAQEAEAYTMSIPSGGMTIHKTSVNQEEPRVYMFVECSEVYVDATYFTMEGLKPVPMERYDCDNIATYHPWTKAWGNFYTVSVPVYLATHEVKQILGSESYTIEVGRSCLVEQGWNWTHCWDCFRLTRPIAEVCP